MKQVFVNIMVNALQAIGEPGKIQIACGPSIFFQRTASSLHGKVSEKNLSRQVDLAPYAWVRIEDNGQGISDEVLSKIFYPFLRRKKRDRALTCNRPEDRRQSSWQYRCESEVGRGTCSRSSCRYRKTNSSTRSRG
jgi:signal transduction histidine kinase